MLRAFKTLFSPPEFQAEAHKAYVSLVEQARKPFFFQDGAVPDTLDGRFDVIVLHMFLLGHRLRQDDSEEAGEFNRVLQEVFFSDMDRSVREMGVSDTGVGKRIKLMAQAFYGRLQAYSNGIADGKHFKESLKRNLYREADIADAAIVAVQDYCMRTLTILEKQNTADILRGDIRFN